VEVLLVSASTEMDRDQVMVNTQRLSHWTALLRQRPFLKA
jgi:hypothetical protein